MSVVDPEQLSDADLAHAGIAGFGRMCGQLAEEDLRHYAADPRHDVLFYRGQAAVASLELARREALAQ